MPRNSPSRKWNQRTGSAEEAKSKRWNRPEMQPKKEPESPIVMPMPDPQPESENHGP